jgi:ornithine cyclodeaminase/alanine dehydrogenase-like protein (mu-crystallin family)
MNTPAPAKPVPIEWFTEADVTSTVTLRGVADHLQTMLIGLHDGKVQSLPKIASANPAKSLHVLASAETEGRYGGVKCWVNAAKGGAVAVYLLFDIEQGRLLATIEAGALGALRTAAAALLAARAMKPAGAAKVAIIGSGRQAFTQLAAALIAVAPRQVNVWSPTAANREAFAVRASESFKTDVQASPTIEQAVQDADVIVTVTRSAEPVLALSQLSKRDLHINAMGAIFADRAELAPDIVARASRVAVDDITRATTADRELRPWLETSGNTALALGTVLKNPGTRPAGLSIFKSWGLGASDLAVAKAVYEARAGQAATKIAYPVPAGGPLMTLLSSEFTRSNP